MSDAPSIDDEPTDEAHPYQWAVDGPPLGIWRTFEGTFSNVMATELTFAADGTGTVLRQSGLFGDEVTPLRWRQNEPGELCLILIFDDEDEHDADTDDADTEDADVGDTFRYTVGHHQSDAGSSPVLINEPLVNEPPVTEASGWIPAGGFWTLPAPVVLVAAG